MERLGDAQGNELFIRTEQRGVFAFSDRNEAGELHRALSDFFGFKPKGVLPATVKIVDIVYTIKYVDKPSDVDINGQQSLAGQIDYFTRTIRIHKGTRADVDIRQTLWHEILHAISERLRIQNNQLHADEDAIDLLAIGINIAQASFEKE